MIMLVTYLILIIGCFFADYVFPYIPQLENYISDLPLIVEEEKINI